MSILIVDDSAGQRLLLSSLLKVDLILMDISMPGLNGIEACHRIKAVEPLHDIPIIMVTAGNEAEDLRAAFAAGAIDYITKPPNK